MTAPRSSARQVLFVVLSYNGYEDTVQCLDSIYANLPDSAAVLVIDNASYPPVAPALQARFPSTEVIALPTNTGWAGGNNIGIELALERGFEWMCLLNNDTVFPDGQVTAWCDSLLQAPPALMHPAIYYWDEPDVAQLCPVGEATWHGNVLMNYAYGACLGIHRNIFEKIGSFDERFFLQLEETDFYHRAVDAGYVAVCDPTVKIFHKESRAFGGKQTPSKRYYSTRNSLLLTEKRRESVAVKFALMRDLYWSIAHAAAAGGNPAGFVPTVRWLLSDAVFATAVRAGIADYLRRRFGKMPPGLSAKLVPLPVISLEKQPEILGTLTEM